jgi:hypothetical protein
MDVFTLPQLKAIAKHFNLKNVKISAKKPELIQQIEQYVHFDGYQFHIIKSNEDQYIKHELLNKHPRPIKKTKKSGIDAEGNFEPVEQKQKKIKIKTKKNENDDEFPIILNLAPLKKKEPKEPKEKKEPKLKKIIPKKEIIDDPTRDFDNVKDFLAYLDYLEQKDYNTYDKVTKRLVDYSKRGIKTHLNVYNQLI